MIKHLLLFIGTFLSFAGSLLAQNGKLSGKVTDKESKEPVPFATVKVLQGNVMKGGATADFDGKYMVSPITPGTYDVEFSSIGYKKRTVKGVVINFETTTNLPMQLVSESSTLEEVVVTTYKVPLIDKDNTSTGTKLTDKDIEKLPTRNINAVLTTTAGVYSNDDGGSLNIRGNRGGDNAVFINGIRQFGTSLPPVEAIAELSVITGGVPAQYGDALGGIISITTKGPASKLTGNIQGETSMLFDKWRYNFLGASSSGPLLKIGGKTDSLGNTSERKTLIGYFAALQYTGQRDDDPSAFGYYRIKEDAYTRMINNPIRPFSSTYRHAADFLSPNDIEKIKYVPNGANDGVQFNANVDIQPKDNMLLTVGGNFNYFKGNNGINFNIFNYRKNSVTSAYDWNGFIRFRQNFNTGIADSNALIKNLYYQVQVDFTNRQFRIYDPDFKADIAKYNHVGRFGFRTIDVPFDSAAFIDQGGNPVFIGEPGTIRNLQTNFLTFERTNNSPLGLYNEAIFNREENIFGYEALSNFNGFQNQSLRPAGYFFPTPGSSLSGYSIGDQRQFRTSVQAGFNLKNHSIKLGGEYEQRVISSYGMAPIQYIRGEDLVNQHLILNDLRFHAVGPNNEVTLRPFIKVDEAGNVLDQTDFDRNIRRRLGLGVNEIININSIGPENINLRDFTPYEIFDNGIRPMGTWQGYNAYGDRQGGTFRRASNFFDFFRDTLNRPVDAFRPIYYAGFIEDKFEIDDLIIRLGLRVDRFDVNMPVLRDPYSLTRLRLVGETDMSRFLGEGGQPYQRPGNIGDDYAIYVNKSSDDFDGNNQSTYKVLGFRQGNRWFDDKGLEVGNPAILESNGSIFPWYNLNGRSAFERRLHRQSGITQDAFTDFRPQTNFLPRVSFSFPISEDALFFAHYDVLTQRPLNSFGGQNYATPSDYYTLRQNQGAFINNPNLNPQKKIDYQVGFQQRLNATSALKLSAFYSEIRDLIQVINVLYAYPTRYVTNGNQDFSTVKGFTLQYDLRRTGNFTANASYTLQFAEGSASDFAGNLLNTATPVIRNTIPLNFDQRHAFKLNFDYHLNKNEGPEIAGVRPFENMGFNTTFFAGSGTPYTADGSPWGGRFQIKGSINGSRLPWNNRTSLRVDKSFYVQREGKKEHMINVYFYVQNLFNVQNVLNVYARTGSPTNDGFLESDFGQQQIRSQSSPEAYAYFYNMTVVNPENVSLPRRMRLGFSYNF
jgi:outer membrane receptor protein involved in Fe transport